MGCDIHIVLERREPDSEWVGIWLSDALPGNRPPIAERDYDFFAEVAAVRGRTDTSVYPRNLPKDVSRLAWLSYLRAPSDHHSVSHMSVADFVAAWLRAHPDDRSVRREWAVYDLLRVNGDDDQEWRVVFWFDN